MGYTTWEVYVRLYIGSTLLLTATFCGGDTDFRDVAAINTLYVALGSPPLRGWIPLGGDPCLEKWEGVDCVFSNITAIRLRGMNLAGELGNSLDFQSLIEMDLSSNRIGGTIPSILPPPLRNFSLSANQLTGSIPDALSSLTQLSDLSLSNNHLTGGIPDAFQLMSGLVNMDLSGNILNGPLPPSMGNLSSLNTLHLQNNQLSGTLATLQDLPLQDLNVEHNLFSGPIPPKLLNVPNFSKDGNPFNTSIISPSPALSPSPFAGAPYSAEAPWKLVNGPSASETPMTNNARKFFTPKRIIWIAVAGAFILMALGLCLFVFTCIKRRLDNKNAERLDIGVYMGPSKKPKSGESSPTNQFEKVPKEAIMKPLHAYGLETRGLSSTPKVQPNEQGMHFEKVAGTVAQKKDNELDLSGLNSSTPHWHPQAPPPPTVPVINQTLPTDLTCGSQPAKCLRSSSVKIYTVATLQQYTNSFSQENYIGEGTLGSCFRAAFPDGKLLAVKKLDTTACTEQSHEAFLELVSGIFRIQHANVVKLVGYCAQHGQRLLVYEYCSNGTLHDALHKDNEIHQSLSWSKRIRVALEAARALVYMHEDFQPPLVHRNFKSANVLLNGKLEVLVSDCGLAPLLSSRSMSQFSGIASGYIPPESELGSYTHQSDVYSFGVVMLELLTGRKPYDRSRPRGEQFLVRWAVPQLHDIDALSRMVDPFLKGAYPMRSLSRFADIISSCLQREPEFRPAMSEIIHDLCRMI